MKLHKQKLQLSQQGATVGVAGPQAGAQVQPSQAGAQLGPGATSRTGAVLTGTTVAGLQVARLVRDPERDESIRVEAVWFTNIASVSSRSSPGSINVLTVQTALYCFSFFLQMNLLKVALDKSVCRWSYTTETTLIYHVCAMTGYLLSQLLDFL